MKAETGFDLARRDRLVSKAAEKANNPAAPHTQQQSTPKPGPQLTRDKGIVGGGAGSGDGVVGAHEALVNGQQRATWHTAGGAGASYWSGQVKH